MSYAGAKTPILFVTDIPAEFSGNLYRLRATNEWGARYSDAAELTVGAAFFQIPLSSLGDSRAFVVAADYCPFIGHDPFTPPGPCGSYLFENTHTPDELNGYFSQVGPGPGGEYSFSVSCSAIKSVGAIVGPISGKLAGAFSVPSSQNITISSNLSGACGGCDHVITLSVYDESGILIHTGTVTDTPDDTPLSIGPFSYPAGNYLVVMEYSINGTVGAGWGASFGMGVGTVGIPSPLPIALVSPTIFDQSIVQTCGSAC